MQTTLNLFPNYFHAGPSIHSILLSMNCFLKNGQVSFHVFPFLTSHTSSYFLSIMWYVLVFHPYYYYLTRPCILSRIRCPGWPANGGSNTRSLVGLVHIAFFLMIWFTRCSDDLWFHGWTRRASFVDYKRVTTFVYIRVVAMLNTTNSAFPIIVAIVVQ